MSIEGITLEHFSALPQKNINSTTPSRQLHAVFHSFFMMIAKKMLPLILHTEIVLFHCLKTKTIEVVIKYNMVKH